MLGFGRSSTISNGRPENKERTRQIEAMKRGREASVPINSDAPSMRSAIRWIIAIHCLKLANYAAPEDRDGDDLRNSIGGWAKRMAMRSGL